MKTATATIILDKRWMKTDNTFAVKLRIYFNGKKKLYSLGVDLNEPDFKKATQKSTTQNKKLAPIQLKLSTFQHRANEVLSKLKPFSFDAFERAYFTNRDVYSNVYTAFDSHINDLIVNGRIATAESYKSAKVSLQSFKKDVQFSDINKSFLTRYEKWMLNNGKSITTIGIYLRSLRTIYNLQESVNPNLYPFGDKKHQYSIPESRNIKKALQPDEIAKIFHAELNGTIEKYRDLWIFLFLANGMNVVDMCNLKHSDVENDKITFVREKTKNTKRTKTKTQVHITPQLKEIINKYGTKSLNKDDYLFPFFTNKMDDEQKHATRRQVTKMINKYMKLLAIELDIKSPVTTMVARHSFATTLKRANVNTETISEMMMHTSVSTTKNYLASLDTESIEKASSHLTDILKAN